MLKGTESDFFLHQTSGIGIIGSIEPSSLFADFLIFVNGSLVGLRQNRLIVTRDRLRPSIEDNIVMGEDLVAVLYEVGSSDAGLKDIIANSGVLP